MLAAIWARTINHDTAWYLLATREWLEGARLYVDYYEVNPPLNFYYTVPALLLADMTGISDANGQYLLTSCLMFVSLFWCWQLMGIDGRLGLARRTVLLIGFGVAFTLPALADFCQREHLLVMFAAPWLVAQAVQAKAVQVRAAHPSLVAPAAFAALGICLKPHFLLLPLTITLWHVLQARSLRPILSRSNLVIFCVGLAYTLGAYLLHPAYFHDIIPLVRAVYGDIGGTSQSVLMRMALTLVPFSIAGLALLFSRTRPAGTSVFLLASLGGLL
ncbi:MAG: hypothetical protein WBA91_08320, partial [Paracoccaceae bacterium]